MADDSDQAEADRFVLDSSMALSWCFPDEQPSNSDRLLVTMASGARAVVPALWYLEIVNALVMGERRKRLKPSETTIALELLSRLPIDLDDRSGSHNASAILALARKYHLTAYDAAYLELAMRLRLPLATLDEKLQKAGRKAKLPKWE